MNIGMLWFDNDNKTDLAGKIRRAAEYYQNKYGLTPNLCFVHPSMLPTPPQDVGMEIRPTKSVLPNHFWLGVNAAN
jgi:hypothetical protein